MHDPSAFSRQPLRATNLISFTFDGLLSAAKPIQSKLSAPLQLLQFFAVLLLVSVVLVPLLK